MTDWKEKRRSEYAEKLKDPRWQKMRLQVLERDQWTCQMCDSTDKTLHVHHFYYERGHQPWEYPLEAFQTLCMDCHAEETEFRPREEEWLLQELRKLRLSSRAVAELMLTFHEMDFSLVAPEDFIGALYVLADNPRFPKIIMDMHDKVQDERHAELEALALEEIKEPAAKEESKPE